MTREVQNLDRIFKAPDEPALLNVNGLFSGGSDGKIYLVPNWQRDYSWDADEEVRLLLEDLKQFFDKKACFCYVFQSTVSNLDIMMDRQTWNADLIMAFFGCPNLPFE